LHATAAQHSAQTQATRAREMSPFLKQTLLSIDPLIAQGRDTSVLRDVLSKTTRRLETELGDQNETRAELYLLVGQVYTLIGQPRDAQAALRQCISLLESQGPAGASALRAKALQQLAYALDSCGEIAEAVNVAEQSLALRDKMTPEEQVETLRLASMLRRREG